MSELEIIEALDKIIAEAEKLKKSIGNQFNQAEFHSQIDIEELIDHDKVYSGIPNKIADVQRDIKNMSIEDQQALMNHNVVHDALKKLQETSDEKYMQFLQSKIKKNGGLYGKE